MIFRENTAAGIYISQDQISIVLLKRGKNGPELVRSAVAPMPEGAVKDGNIADAALLSKAIRNLKVRSRIRTSRAAVSLFAKPVVVQIMDMPQQMPSNIRQFVDNEVKHCVALPSRDVVFDFCGIGSARRTACKRVLAVAAESARMVKLVRVCDKAGFKVELIEPPLVAYLRAIHKQKVTDKSGWNVLVAMLRGTALTLCVLKNGAMDFIRTQEMAKGSDGSDDLNCWLADELSEVVRFYDSEASENACKWEITAFVDAAQSPQATEEYLKSRITASSLQVRTIEDAYRDTLVAGSAMANKEHPSPVAVGLAMRLLMQAGDDVSINLVPREIERAREAQKDVLIAANAVALLLLIILLAVGGLTAMFGRVSQNAAAKQLLITKRNTDDVLVQHQHLDVRLWALSNLLDKTAHISASHRDVNWVEVFDDIREATPGSVRITSLSSQDGARVLIEGLAVSNEAVNSFVNLLEKSRSVVSVILLETRKQEGQNGFITYQLSCKLAIRSGKVNDAG
jgi:Tfp pilus assembly protein PilN